MIYDNERCLAEAQRLVRLYGTDRDELIKQISGELMRFHRLGLSYALKHFRHTYDKVNAAVPGDS